ncbi:MAG: PucR family transcriptional regulator ligand-binding domain-containing protein, partial [Bifidobacteriaceae bacterium]|nr:PucR family transcriptional regulator ligand-binding domain-containing protein [Bifidobacteriaceae bacterium]
MLTLRAALALPELAGATVVAGQAGLGREVRAANVMEVPDIDDYVEA